jgi:hypothetical protein
VCAFDEPKYCLYISNGHSDSHSAKYSEWDPSEINLEGAFDLYQKSVNRDLKTDLTPMDDGRLVGNTTTIYLETTLCK